ncbi:MAG: TIGR00282 family metallophosphoesterase [Rhodobiaceae bacterium]|nr:TIGR00282 family metallophosphoesterase [Rhodobiaceae bacterium]
MRLLCVGDVVGRSGRRVVQEHLPRLIEDLKIDFVVLNGENAAGGFGITETICGELLDMGADVVTTGNHVWDQREALVFIERQHRLLRPLNYPAGTPGRGANVFTAKNGARVLVMNAMGRIFMDAMDDPFAAIEKELESCRLGHEVDAVIVDFHAEATSEKLALAHFLDGRVSALFGTHTHIPTADHQVLAGGSAYMSDLGMCGDYDSVIGMDKEEPLRRFLTKIPSGRFEAASGEATFSALAVEIDDASGLAGAAAPVRIGGRLAPALPAFWSA